MQELFDLISKTYGIAGLIILSPFVGIFFLWRANQSLHLQLAALSVAHAKTLETSTKEFLDKILLANDKIVAAQVQRVQDAQGISTMLVTIVSEQSSLNKETNMALDKITEFLPKRSNYPLGSGGR